MINIAQYNMEMNYGGTTVRVWTQSTKGKLKRRMLSTLVK